MGNGQQSVSQWAWEEGTWRADAQVTTAPGVQAITPSRMKLYFCGLQGRFCKPVISHLTASAALGPRSASPLGRIHQYTSVSSSSIEPSITLSICFQGVTSLFPTSRWSFTAYFLPLLSLLFVVCLLKWQCILHTERWGRLKLFCHLLLRVLIIPENC